LRGIYNEARPYPIIAATDLEEEKTGPQSSG